ncbi:MAG: lysylphosphatidylglycerol synthase transmembrane domain-containing protein [Deltaproteobacteria bacterium]|nr:lysylphosphatidylglycerol synthase transmembrane domain-containing protein [Deltaproteobacteria bacterium]
MGVQTIDATPVTRPSRWRSLVLGLTSSITILAVLGYWIDWRAALQVLRRVDAWRLVVPALVTLAGWPLRPWRWREIFPVATRPSFRAAFSALTVGTMANNVLPGRGGDLLRVVLVAPRGGAVRASLALGTLAVEKILDGLALLAVLLVARLVLDVPAWFAHFALGATLLFGAAIVFVALLRWQRDRLLSICSAVLRRLHLPRLADIVVRVGGQFADGLTALRTAPQWFGVSALTVVIWGLEAVQVWLLAAAWHIPLPLAAAAVVTAVIGLGMSVPAGPSSLGAYELSGVGGLMLFGVPSADALALTLGLHMWMLLNTTIAGAFGFAVGGLRAETVLHAGDAAPADA